MKESKGLRLLKEKFITGKVLWQTDTGAMDARDWRMRFALEWKLQDLWIGAYWKHEDITVFETGDVVGMTLDVWVCLFPCLPLHIRYERLFVNYEEKDA